MIRIVSANRHALLRNAIMKSKGVTCNPAPQYLHGTTTRSLGTSSKQSASSPEGIFKMSECLFAEAVRARVSKNTVRRGFVLRRKLCKLV